MFDDDDPPRMPFGKYKNFPIDELPAGYLAWLLSEVDLRPRLRAALEQEAERRAAQSGRRHRQQHQHRPAPPPPQRSMPTADEVESIITAGQHALARKHHPDIGGDVNVMKRINGAVDWLRATVRGLL